jgi:hypothetical protein
LSNDVVHRVLGELQIFKELISSQSLQIFGSVLKIYTFLLVRDVEVSNNC